MCFLSLLSRPFLLQRTFRPPTPTSVYYGGKEEEEGVKRKGGGNGRRSQKSFLFGLPPPSPPPPRRPQFSSFIFLPRPPPLVERIPTYVRFSLFDSYCTKVLSVVFVVPTILSSVSQVCHLGDTQSVTKCHFKCLFQVCHIPLNTFLLILAL